jgi:hypothetical protein
VLEPAEAPTLRELCEFIAQASVRPSIEPVSIMGTTCLNAGAFLAIRSLLRDAGVARAFVCKAVTPSKRP